jgi:hypothetical protein
MLFLLWLDTIRARLAKTPNPSSRLRRQAKRDHLFRPRLEVLEERAVPAKVLWIAGSGDWDTAANWSTGTLPTPADDVAIGTSGITVTHLAPKGDAVHSLTCGATLTMSSGSLILAAASTISSGLVQMGGTIGGAGSLTVSGPISWSGGTMSGTGTTFANGGLLLTASSTIEVLDRRTFNNKSGATWSGTNTLLFADGAVFNNLAGATFDIKNDQTLGVGLGTNPVFNNLGTLTKEASGGAGSPPPMTSIFPLFHNEGTVSVSSGTIALNSGGAASAGKFKVAAAATLDFNGGVYKLGTGSSISGAGNVLFTAPSILGITDVNGTYAITGTTSVGLGAVANFSGTLTSIGSVLTVDAATANFHKTITVPTVNLLDNGTLAGTADMTITSAFNWTGPSTLSGTGATTVIAPATLKLTGTGAETLDGRTLNNSGTVTWSGANDLSFLDRAVFNNLSGATFTITNDQTIFTTGAEVMNNAGTILKNATTMSTSVDVAFNNSYLGTGGTVTVNSGTLALLGGGTSVSPASFTVPGGTLNFGGNLTRLGATTSITGAGVVGFVSGTTDVLGTYNVTGQTNVLAGASASFANTVTSVGKLLVVNGGTATLNQKLTTPSINLLNGGTLTGAGDVTVSQTLNWTGPSTLSGTGAFTVAAGATLNLLGAAADETLSRTLNNLGTVNWMGTDDLNFASGAIFNNQAGATVSIQNDQAILAGAASAQFNNGGTVVKNPGVVVTTINVSFNNSNAVTVTSGTLALPGGGNDTAGKFTVNGGGTLNFGGTLTRLGSGVQGAGTVRYVTGITDITGVYNITGSTNVSGGTANFTAPVVNIGPTLTISDGLANIVRAITIKTVNLTGGTLTGAGAVTITTQLNWSGNNTTMSGTGTTTIAVGATMTISDAAGAGILDGRVLRNAGTATWGGGYDLDFRDGAMLNNTGTFTVNNDQTILTTIGATGVINNSGTFTKPTAAALTTIDAVFNNLNTVTCTVGEIDLLGGGNSTGKFNANGTLAFGGTVTGLSATSKVIGTGTVNFVFGTTTVAGIYNISGATNVITGGTVNFTSSVTNVGSPLTIDGTANFSKDYAAAKVVNLTGGGVLTGSGNLTIGTAFNWTGPSIMSGTGTTSVAASGTMAITGLTTFVALDGRTLTNKGTATWSLTVDIWFYEGAVLNNLSGATFLVKNDQALIQKTGAVGAVNNVGTFSKIMPSAATTAFGVGFNNSGTVNVTNGTLALSAGGNSSGKFNVPAGSTLSFSGETRLTPASTLTAAGEVDFLSGLSEILGTYTGTGTTGVTGVSSGTANFVGKVGALNTLNVMADGTAYFSVNVTVTTLNLSSGGLLTGPSTITVPGTLNWTGPSVMAGTGTTTVTGTGTLNFLGAGDVTETLFSRTLNNNGSAFWTGANYINIGFGGALNNNAGASFDIENDQLLLQFVPIGGTFNNKGTLAKTIATGDTSITAVFNNTGKVSLSTGGVGWFNGGSSGSGTFDLGAGTTLGILGGASTVGKISGDGNVLIGGGATDVVGAYSITGTTTVMAGSISFLAVASTGPVTDSGVLEIGTGIAFTVSGVYLQSGGVTFLDGGTLTATSVVLASGTFSGQGSIVGDVTNSGSLFVADDGYTGTLAITGSFTQTAAGALFFDIGGLLMPQYDLLKVSGAATLDGSLTVSFINGFVPVPGNSWTIMTYASVTGSFASASVPDGFAAFMTPTSVVIGFPGS